eukprot:scaffold242936_cov27-Tisochrysis_lutea.AAC.1
MGMAQKLAGLMEAARKRPAGEADKTFPSETMGSTSAAAVNDAAPAGFKSNVVFETMETNLNSQPALAGKVNGSFAFNITGGPAGASATWSVVAKGPSPSVTPKKMEKADCTITISDENLVALASGKINGMSAYMSGKMKVKGNMGLAQKLAALMGPGPRSKM